MDVTVLREDLDRGGTVWVGSRERSEGTTPSCRVGDTRQCPVRTPRPADLWRTVDPADRFSGRVSGVVPPERVSHGSREGGVRRHRSRGLLRRDLPPVPLTPPTPRVRLSFNRYKVRLVTGGLTCPFWPLKVPSRSLTAQVPSQTLQHPTPHFQWPHSQSVPQQTLSRVTPPWLRYGVSPPPVLRIRSRGGVTSLVDPSPVSGPEGREESWWFTTRPGSCPRASTNGTSLNPDGTAVTDRPFPTVREGVREVGSLSFPAPRSGDRPGSPSVSSPDLSTSRVPGGDWRTSGRSRNQAPRVCVHGRVGEGRGTEFGPRFL